MSRRASTFSVELARAITAALLLAGPAFWEGVRAEGGERPAAPGATPRPQRIVTFARDIAPILFERCAVCHHPGSLAPFSLLTYPEVRARATQIAAVTTTRFMPPWKPEPGYGDFVGDRRLSDEEITLIREWVEGGGIEGNPSDLPPAPTWPSEWHLGTPDLVVATPEAYWLRAEGPNEYRNFVIPIPIATTKYVRGFQFRPGSPAVHHARILIDRTGSARRLDAKDLAPGYDDLLGDDAEFPEGHLLAWAPGKIPAVEPEELAWRLRPGTDLVVQFHLQPTGKPEPIQAEVGFYFSETPPTRSPAVILLGNKTIDIPAGASHHVVEDAYRLPVDVEVLAVYPHAHFLGKELQAFATRPDGSRKWLIRITDWDFNWQDEYRFVEPIRLPRGTTLRIRYVYDNSAGNPRNPSHPPQRVRYGRQSTDEMAELVVQVLTRTPEDLVLLNQDFAVKANAVNIAGAEKRADDNPGDFKAHHELASYYLEAGRLEEATDRFEETLRQNPGFAPAHYNLGIILAGQRRLEEAADRFRQALAHVPEYAAAHTNLGVVLQAMGRLDEAISHYRQAIRIEPEVVEAHNNLAVALQSVGKVDEAVSSYRRVLAIRPDAVGAHNDLGVVLARQGRFEEAMGHYREALRLNPSFAQAHYNLAVSLAGQQKPAEAIHHYRQALAVQADEPAFLNGFAWMLATYPDPRVRNPQEAIRLAERAASLTQRGSALVLDTLAAAYAAAGQYGQAVMTAQAALALIPSGQATELAAGIRSRLELYTQRQPYRQP